jgi:secondary thiamine-phosphate synthase enzyme
MIYQHEIQLQTSPQGQMHNLTDEIAQVVGESKVCSGLVNIFNIGSTGAIGTIEFEPGLQQVPALLDKLMPPGRDYGHERAWHDGNGHSHLQATMLGPSLTVPVKDGKLVLGTWQQVFHLECDIKPRRRTIAITVMGES